MAAKVPTNEHTRKLLQLITRYDIDELLYAATSFQYRPVISNAEKREIDKQSGSSRQQKFDHLITLVTKNAERMTRFAMFIQSYTSPIQEAASNALLEYQNPETVTTSRGVQNAEKLTLVADQKSFDSSSSDIFDIGTANSQEHYSMENRDNIPSQVNNLLSASQKSSDIGYCSGLSKDLQSLNLSAHGDECASVQSQQRSLEVMKKHHHSRQLRKQQRRSDVTRNQSNHFYQPTVVVHNHNHYHIPGKDEQQMKYDQWPPLLAKYNREIIKRLHMEMLVPHLVERKLLTMSEYHELAACPSWKQSEYFVLKVLPAKGDDGFKRFMECLREEEEHSGHQDLFRLLENCTES